VDDRADPGNELFPGEVGVAVEPPAGDNRVSLLSCQSWYAAACSGEGGRDSTIMIQRSIGGLRVGGGRV
jgi:hypothetical protein